MTGVAWFGGDDALARALGRLGVSAVLLTASDDYDEVAAAVPAGAEALVWRGVGDRARDLLVRCALAEVGFGGRLVYARPTFAPPGFALVDDPGRLGAPPEPLTGYSAEAVTAALVADGGGRRAVVGGEPMDDDLAAAWSASAEPLGLDLARVRWPLVHRFPQLVVGIVRAVAAGAPGGWEVLAERAPSLPFPAPALRWARRAHAEAPTAATAARLDQRFAAALAERVRRGRERQAAELLAAWRAARPGPASALHGLLEAWARGDGGAVLAAGSGGAGGAARGLVLRARAAVLAEGGELEGAEAALRAGLAAERAAGEALEGTPHALLSAGALEPTPAPGGGVSTRAALARVLLGREAVDDARVIARGLPEGAVRDTLIARVELAAGDAARALGAARLGVARAESAREEVEARLVLGLALAASGASGGDEAARAWARAAVDLPPAERLVAALALRPLLAEEVRGDVDSDVAFVLEDVPETLRARRAWLELLA